MKKKYLIIIIFVILVLLFAIPVHKEEGRWVNDSEICDVGHYLTLYYNMFGIKICEK